MKLWWREGFSFNVEVAYEWLPDFRTHCQNIGHDVSSCQWLYPRKDINEAKENTVKGKKQVPLTKLGWMPTKENPSGIGSSSAFEAPKQETPQAIVLTSAATNAHNELPTPIIQVAQDTQQQHE